MRSLFFLIVLTINSHAGSVFVSPTANFQDRTIIFSFLPDIDRPVMISECSILIRKRILSTFKIGLTLDPIKEIGSKEWRVPLPARFRNEKDLDGTSVKCVPAFVKSSTWILSGLNE